MTGACPVVIFDACVLYPSTLRNLLLWLALTDRFRARWTDRIHEEWMKAVLADYPDIDPRICAELDASWTSMSPKRS